MESVVLSVVCVIQCVTSNTVPHTEGSISDLWLHKHEVMFVQMIDSRTCQVILLIVIILRRSFEFCWFFAGWSLWRRRALPLSRVSLVAYRISSEYCVLRTDDRCLSLHTNFGAKSGCALRTPDYVRTELCRVWQILFFTIPHADRLRQFFLWGAWKMGSVIKHCISLCKSTKLNPISGVLYC